MEFMETSQLNSTAVFTQYVDVVNRSIGKNRDDFPFKQMLTAADRLLDDKKIAVAIYKEDPDEPHDWMMMRFDDGSFRIAQHGKGDASLTWRAKEDYVRKVVESPQEYIDHPSKLDFDWLKSRLGMD